MKRPRPLHNSSDDLPCVKGKESSSGSPTDRERNNQIEILSECLQYLLNFRKREVLVQTISADLIGQAKESLLAAQRRLASSTKANTAPKKQKVKTQEGPEQQTVLADIQNASQIIQNLEMLQQEEAMSTLSLAEQTETLNKKMRKHFKFFREHPVRAKNFSEQEKALTRKVLDDFENSSDEEVVKLEGIKLGDGTYDKIAQFSSNVHKLQKLIKARQTIEEIKNRRSDKIRSDGPRKQRRAKHENFQKLTEPYKRQKLQANDAQAVTGPTVSV